MLTIAVCAGLLVAGCGGSDDSSTESTKPGVEVTGGGSEKAASSEKPTKGESGEKTKPKVLVPKGDPPKKLEIEELEKGTGAEAKSGDLVVLQYVGVDYKTGQEFDASWDRGEPFGFTLGAGEVIPGWEKGVVGMKEGGRRELIIPPELAYGETGYPPSIAPNETLVFVIDLLEVK